MLHDAQNIMERVVPKGAIGAYRAAQARRCSALGQIHRAADAVASQRLDVDGDRGASNAKPEAVAAIRPGETARYLRASISEGAPHSAGASHTKSGGLVGRVRSDMSPHRQLRVDASEQAVSPAPSLRIADTGRLGSARLSSYRSSSEAVRGLISGGTGAGSQQLVRVHRSPHPTQDCSRR